MTTTSDQNLYWSLSEKQASTSSFAFRKTFFTDLWRNGDNISMFDSVVVPSDLHMASAVVRAKPFRQLAMFFNRTAPIWSVVRSLTDGMRDEKINYAMVGGLALYAHGYHRMTTDIDILLAKSVRKLGQFKDVFFGSFDVSRSDRSSECAHSPKANRTETGIVSEGWSPTYEGRFRRHSFNRTPHIGSKITRKIRGTHYPMNFELLIPPLRIR